MPGFGQLDLNKCMINVFFPKSIMHRQRCPPFLPHLPCLGTSLLPYLQQVLVTFSRYTHEVTKRLSGQVCCLSMRVTHTGGWGHLRRSEPKGQLYLGRSHTDTTQMFAVRSADA